ncbi:hypothetical protein HFO42_31815 [Rhizobium leguminosarum]|uniref:Uncharacterized protein n=1 Tax=Rhizobium leguminosarum TaxID=384 RepID=A0AAJ1EHM6_RHILE|nr:hypothetical protein [Rhizobium leguminosarum]MBY5537104.1 hypothetical protein [Rhizobium leguminosarum]MBY5599230.1 hypothetical protein [Rhizobium leguminosarum]MBY5619182.1 hypothetical protein [Rhizobium leguminosarum]MBY5632621.1 hypothetical protein [Rhizobium leguminosarum]MBY5729934.1 hypothetical protein [Rhizobium leguminosarum]
MTDDAAVTPEPTKTAADIELRRYEARLGVWKVVLGTMIVGLAGVLIPGLVSFYTTYFESLRKDAELSQAQQAAHQQYIKDFFDTAVNQDIELRIRFANYFANLSGEDQRQLWQSYRDSQTETRGTLRTLINELERKMTLLNPERQNEFSTAEKAAEYKELERRRDWAYREIGYVAIESTAVSTQGRSKRALYDETVELVARLAGRTAPFDPSGKDWVRFWTLYNVELIDVESREFARVMIAIGNALKRLAATQSLPDDELKKLVQDLTALAHQELSGLTRAVAQ